MKIKVWIMEYDVKKTRGKCSRDVDEMQKANRKKK